MLPVFSGMTFKTYLSLVLGIHCINSANNKIDVEYRQSLRLEFC